MQVDDYTFSRSVLIETYWNVKKVDLDPDPKPDLGINRNILECKEPSEFKKYCVYVSINRNILECKDQPVNHLFFAKKGINRNI